MVLMKFCYSLHLLLHKSMEKGHSKFIIIPLVHPLTHFKWNQNKHRTVLLRLRAQGDLIRRAFQRMTLETNCTIASPGHPVGQGTVRIAQLSRTCPQWHGSGAEKAESKIMSITDEEASASHRTAYAGLCRCRFWLPTASPHKGISVHQPGQGMAHRQAKHNTSN